jgi:beta-mannosidase
VFKVNGKQIFAKGANMIPLDSFEGRVKLPYLESVIKSSVKANMNMVR